MKINPAFTQNRPPSSAEASLLFKADADALATLTLGQIIKGRVLRSFEGQRYLMEFSGQEKVVDSAVPLRIDEVIHGRVVGLGERIELKKINVESSDLPQAPGEGENAIDLALYSSKSARLVQELFTRYQARIDPSEMDLLERTVARAARPDLMALSGLILTKLGLRLAPEFLRSVFGALAKNTAEPLFAARDEVVRLAVADVVMPDSESDTAAFGAALQRVVTQGAQLAWQPAKEREVDVDSEPAFDAGAQSGDEHGHQQRPGPEGIDRTLARWILNTQTGGATAHRVATLPLLINDRLVELDLALFEQMPREEQQPEQGLTHRQVVLSLDTDGLGRVEVKAQLASDHIRVAVTTDSSETTQFMSSHATSLSTQLQSLGWQVDELSYVTLAHVGMNAVMHSVVEHVIAPGSVSRMA